MYWSYEYVSQKLFPKMKNLWTVKEIIEATAELGDQVYLIDAPTGREYSYGETNRVANQIANSLLHLGLRKGDRVGILMTNIPEFVLSLFAVGKTGLVEVPININLREREILHMIDQAELSTIIVEAKSEFLQMLANVSKRTTVLQTLIVQGEMADIPDMPAKIVSFRELVENADDTNPTIVVQPADTYGLFFTSGTTGLPKGAPIKQKTFVLASQSVCAIPYITSQVRNYTCLPLFHANAQLYSMTAMRCLGASLVLSNRFSPRTFWQEMNRYQVTYFNSIGGMMQILDSAFAPEDVPEHAVKFVFVGGTPNALWERFEQKFNLEIFEGYSMSEAPVLLGNFHPEKAMRKVGSFGKPIFPDLGRQVRIVDEENTDLPFGTGELVQKGDYFVIEQYWNAPEATSEAIDSEGWFHSGDIIAKDQAGLFSYVDRKKFMIRVAGENVSAFEIEDVVNSHPLVEQSAAIPVPDAIRDEEIKIFIKPKAGEVDYFNIIKHCAERLAYFKVPRYVEIIEEFPKTATERVQKAELKNREKEKECHGWDRNKNIPDWRQRFYRDGFTEKSPF